MTWLSDHWQRLRFNRLDFDRNYVIDQVLSQKPRSRVLLVRPRGGQRQSVMKLTDPVAANPREAECMRSLQHPGIVGYLGHGFTRDRMIWMNTEYIDGAPLSEWSDHPQVADTPNRDCVTHDAHDIFLQLLSIVQYLHFCGWTHGDLSPQNVLVSQGVQRVTLVDFEHTRAIDAAKTTANMPRKHSLAFASPHELAGGTTSESCEQFALGKIGYMLLEHFEDESKAELEAVLSRATSAHPEGRYSNLGGMVRGVEACIRLKRV